MSGTNPQGGAQMKTHLGHYEIVGELGRGGMGVVYKAFEPALNRFVAIKELSPSLAHDPDLVERFLREARSMAQLSDPHIIQIYFIGTDETTRQPFFAMEFVEGDSLSALLKRHGRFSVEDTLKIIHQAAQGLATAHDQGVIHRDIKPGNLMLTKRGQVKIADFGIALATRDLSRKLTSTGEFVGTPGYLSPEVCLARNIDQRSDIFSLGIVMFEMLTGKSPFSDESPLGLMLEVVKAEIPDIRQLNGEADQQTAAILARMVAKEPADRFASCHDLAAALQAHPLVAKGGTVKLAAPAPAPADGATMVGAPTPAAAPRKVTPPPLVRSSDTASAGDNAPTLPGSAAAAAAQAPARPSVLERGAQKKSTPMLPLAVAAVLLLAVAGGAFALRGQIAGWVHGFTDGFAGNSERAYEQGRVAGQASNPVGVSTAAPLATDAGRTTQHDTASPATTQPAIEYPESTAQASGAIESVSDPSLQPATGYDYALASNAQPSSNLASAQALIESPTQVPPPAEQPASQSAPVAAPTQIAVAEKPKPKPVVPVPQRVAVIAIGDSAIVGPARQRVEEELSRAGFDLADADALGAGNSVDGSLRAVARAATVAVVIKAEPIGSEQLSYYGRTSELYSANLTVRAYRTSDRSPIGAGFRQKVQFTNMNADTQAEDAVNGRMDGLMAELAPYKKRG